jgi:hypothetical protein
MIQTPDVPDAMRLPPKPPGLGPGARLAIGLALLASTVALLLFFTLVVSPSAGAAGGCGGG